MFWLWNLIVLKSVLFDWALELFLINLMTKYFTLHNSTLNCCYTFLFRSQRWPNAPLQIWARIYQASLSDILVLSADNSWNVLLLSNLSIKASYLKFLKAKSHSYSPSCLRRLERSLKWLGVASRGLWWRWGDRNMRCANLSREDSEEECSWNVWRRALNQTVIFPQLFKMSKEHLHYQRTS